ncbi:hypothetical protein GIB67_040029, partial [Kingdonia uniflora]
IKITIMDFTMLTSLPIDKYPTQVPYDDRWSVLSKVERETYPSYWAGQTYEIGHLLTNLPRMGNIDMFRPSALRVGITPVVVILVEVHSLSQDFTLPDLEMRPDLGWHIKWTGRREAIPIHHFREPPPISAFYSAEELWHLTHGIWQVALTESVRDAQMIQHLTDENLHLRRGREVRVVPLPPRGGTRQGRGPMDMVRELGEPVVATGGGVLEMIVARLSRYRGYPETNGRGLDPRRFGPFVDDENDSFETIRTDVPPSNEPSIPQSNVHLSNEPVLTNVPQSNEPFQTIPTNVPLSNEPSIPQSSIHLSNEPVLTNVRPSNEPMLTNVPLSIKPEPTNVPISNEPSIPQSTEFRFEPQPEQVKDLLDFWFKSVAYTENPYDFSKEFNIGDLYRDRIELKNHIKAYAVVNKFNLEHVLSNEYKIVMRGSFQHAYQLLTRYFAEVMLVDLDFVFDIQSMSCKDKRFTRYGVAYTNHVESWNNVILKVRDLPIHVFIKELRRICSEMSYTYREEAEKSQACLMPWVTDHCESRKFIADLLTCRVRTSRHHFQMTRYGRTNSVNNEDGTCSCHWWQTMGIPYEHGVRALGLVNVDPTTCVSEY